MASKLEKEFKYYIENQGALIKEYNGKFIVIKECEVIGAYDSEIEAIDITMKNHELGTFLVQKVEPGKESYRQMYHSRASFA
jgi:hypothetical protein